MTSFLVAGLVLQRLLELRLARRNEAWARARGAVEHGREHYPLFLALHAGWLLGTLYEGRRRQASMELGGMAPGRTTQDRTTQDRVRWGWLALLLAAQPLRYWVIGTLGEQWNTRILIVPGATRVTGGPFRYLSHPNYAVVALEMFSAPLSVGAWRTALLGSLLNAALLLGLRIPAEERALLAYRPAGLLPGAPLSADPDAAAAR